MRYLSRAPHRRYPLHDRAIIQVRLSSAALRLDKYLHVFPWLVPQQREAAAHRGAERDPVADERRGLHGTPAQQPERDAEVLTPDV